MDRVAELERALADALLELKAARKFDRALKVGRGWWACEYAETDWFALETARSACNQNPVLVKMIGEVDAAGVVEWCSTPRAIKPYIPTHGVDDIDYGDCGKNGTDGADGTDGGVGGGGRDPK